MGRTYEKTVRKIFPHRCRHSRVLHYESIRLKPGEGAEMLKHFAEFMLENESVECDIDPFLSAVGKADYSAQRFGGEVFSSFSGVESAETAVNGIGTAVKSGESEFWISGR